LNANIVFYGHESSPSYMCASVKHGLYNKMCSTCMEVMADFYAPNIKHIDLHMSVRPSCLSVHTSKNLCVQLSPHTLTNWLWPNFHRW